MNEPTTPADNQNAPMAVASGAVLGCCWSQDRDDGSWATGCGELFVFTDGTPKENGFKFCPYCGRTLSESPYTGDIRDDHDDEYVMELSKQPNNH